VVNTPPPVGAAGPLTAQTQTPPLHTSGQPSPSFFRSFILPVVAFLVVVWMLVVGTMAGPGTVGLVVAAVVLVIPSYIWSVISQCWQTPIEEEKGVEIDGVREVNVRGVWTVVVRRRERVVETPVQTALALEGVRGGGEGREGGVEQEREKEEQQQQLRIDTVAVMAAVRRDNMEAWKGREEGREDEGNVDVIEEEEREGEEKEEEEGESNAVPTPTTVLSVAVDELPLIAVVGGEGREEEGREGEEEEEENEEEAPAAAFANDNDEEGVIALPPAAAAADTACEEVDEEQQQQQQEEASTPLVPRFIFFSPSGLPALDVFQHQVHALSHFSPLFTSCFLPPSFLLLLPLLLLPIPFPISLRCLFRLSTFSLQFLFLLLLLPTLFVSNRFSKRDGGGSIQ